MQSEARSRALQLKKLLTKFPTTNVNVRRFLLGRFETDCCRKACALTIIYQVWVPKKSLHFFELSEDFESCCSSCESNVIRRKTRVFAYWSVSDQKNEILKLSSVFTQKCTAKIFFLIKAEISCHNQHIFGF